MFNGLVLHHIGIATKNIEKEASYFEKLGYKPILKSEDSIQGVYLLFMEADNQPRIELVQNINENGPVSEYLKKGTKLYHYAYVSSNIDKDFEYFTKELNAMVVSPIVDANCFEKICFLMMRNMFLIELVQLK